MKLTIYFKHESTCPQTYDAFNIEWDCGSEDCRYYTFDFYDEESDLIRMVEVSKEEVILVDLIYQE